MIQSIALHELKLQSLKRAVESNYANTQKGKKQDYKPLNVAREYFKSNSVL